MILEEVKSAFSENKLAICASISILCLSLILGYFLEPYLHNFLNPIVEEFTRDVKRGVIKLTFQSIFSNNIRIVLEMFIFGLLCCFSALILAFNGFFVGYYVATTDDLLKAVLLLIPHGIFEFSSCILACASGFVLFAFLYKFIRALMMQSTDSVKEMLAASFAASYDKLKQAIILLMVAVVLMAIAGFVEVYLTLPIEEFLYPILS